MSAAIRASRSDVEFGCGNLIYCRWRGSLLHQGTQLTEDKRRFAVVVIRHACTRKLHISPIDAQSDTLFFLTWHAPIKCNLHGHRAGVATEIAVHLFAVDAEVPEILVHSAIKQ